MKKCLKLLLLFFVLTNCSIAQERIHKSELDFGGGMVFTTFLKISESQNEITITSPKNADKRILGGFKSILGRMLGRLPKKGIFMTIKGEKIGDSIIGRAETPILGALRFKGSIKNDLLTGSLIKNDTLEIGTLKSVKSEETEIDYEYLYTDFLNVTQSNIYSKDVLNTKSWKKFSKSLKRILRKSKDDIELFIGFNVIGQKLPFSHYNLMFAEDDLDTDEDDQGTRAKTVIFEEKNAQTAYLKIKNFSSSQKELADVFPNIIKNTNYQNLIIDLRNNGGGGVEAAFEFAKHLVSDSINVGYFVTNKLKYSGFNKGVFKDLPEVTPSTTKEFIEYLKNNEGAKLVFRESNNHIFSGNLYFLTNRNTASTCEPIVYTFKNTMGATIIGENTAGAMLSAAPFTVNGKYKLILPIADFYTTDGTRLDLKGVAPTIEIESDKALEKALEIINNNAIKNH